MKIELFYPYKETILRCINSSITPEQLQVCYDLIERFEERFRGVVSIEQLNEASVELYGVYQQRTDGISII
ncbi:MAG: hypothetical protein ACT4OJ_04300 [Bacteroidota bacterium]